MEIAVLSLVLLFVAIIISCVSPINIGFLCMGFAFILTYFAPTLKISALVSAFPVKLFILLVGVMFLFSQSQANGTLEKVTKYTMKLARGKAGLLPIIVFFLIMFLASFAGNIAMMALIAPLAMAIAGEARIAAPMMAVMVVNGANAGGFSPIGSAGLISAALSQKIGLPDFAWQTFFNLILGNLIVGLIAYTVFGGFKLWKKDETVSIDYAVEPFNRKQWFTLIGIAVFAILVFFFKVDVGFCALAVAGILSILRVADDNDAIKKVSWGPVMMVCGVSVLMDAAGKAGGLDLFTTFLAQFSTQNTITAILGGLTGIISVYASSSGVVMPTFIPLVPSLIAKMGGGDPIALVSSINLGAHLVDASPVSPGGAMCLAAVAAWVDREKAFRDLMIWGLSMSIVGAIVCWLLFTVLAI